MAERVDRVVGDRLRLAFAGLHPAQSRGLLSEGSAAAALGRIVSGRAGSGRASDAARVPAGVRLEQLARMGAVALWRGGERFPEWLGERPDSPDVLFVRGELPPVRGVAVVGTRRCTSYGRRLALAYGRAIAHAGWPLVSGLARGIDGAAHRGMVDAGGVGVAVLGCGLDVAYPREHRDLAEALVSLGGAIVTEYPPGTPPEAWRFPPRNRIISGLSAAVVVVEANERGGALITAACALEQGVPVFAVPGDVDRAASRGCNLLIRDGAHPVLDPADLVAELELVLGPAARPEVEAPPPVDVVPPEGIDLDSLASELDLTPAEALATTSRWEAQGRATREGERIYPVRVDR